MSRAGTLAGLKRGRPTSRSPDLLDQAIEELLNRIRAYNPFMDEDRLRRACELGRTAHAGQLRASGQPYFTHPVAVARLLADMHMDLDTIITALLHDTVEDCDVTLEEIAAQFGPEVQTLVDGVTKLTRLQLSAGSSKQAENFRKLIVATSDDIRVLLVKLADRQHNMETLESLAEEKRQRIARETMDIFAPLAERLGITRIQNQLEDTAFAVLNPEMRQTLLNRLEFLAAEAENIIPRICQELQILVQAKGIDCQVSGRRKTPYSIHRKMQSKKVAMEQLADVMAFRVIVPDIAACYATLGAIHTEYPMVMGRMKDYISTPKRNGYQSIHTGVIGPMNRRIEIQIRTPEMHDVAERGVAAHWDYKSLRETREAAVFGWVQEMMQLIELSSGAEDLLEHSKMEMYADQVFCFTPRGDLISLPKGATAVDFAYAVHSKIGDHCVGVLINDKKRQLATELANGDQVRILTDETAQPRPDWEEFVATGRAKSAIRRFTRSQRQQEFSRIGQSLLAKEYRFHKKQYSEKDITGVLSGFGVTRLEELYEKIGTGDTQAKQVFERLYPALATTGGAKKTTEKEAARKARADTALNIDGLSEGMAVHMAKCCYPLPGDEIVGIMTTGKGLTIHKDGCSTLTKFVSAPELWMKVGWGQTGAQLHSGRIRCVLFNEPGALAALCTVIGQQGGNISFIQLIERSVDFFTFTLDIDVRDRQHLQSIIAVLGTNQYIETVERDSY